MTSDNYTNNRLNYNSTESAKSLPHVEKLFSTRRKKISYAYAQNILSKELFRTLLVMLLMVTGAAGVWAQEDLSGTYYIGSYGKNADASNKYYLCPTEDWYYYQATNGYVANPNGQPFLTTYKCLSTSGYDTSKAVWIIEKHETEAGCYYIKQKTANPGRYKYIVSNGQISGTSNANRMRIHIEELDENSTALNDLGNMALFEIATYPAEKGKDYNFTTDYLRIKPHDSNGRNGDYIYLVVNNGNFQNLKADGTKPDGPNGTYGKGTGGIISLYTLEQNAGWYLEDVIERPTISFTTDNKVQITGATGTTKIYYTTNGDKPTIGGSTTTEVEGATVSFDPDDNVTTIKAIAIVNGEITNVTTFTPPVLLGSNHKRLIQSQANPWDTDFHFYMIPGDPNNNITKVNTTSLFRPTMEWYFESAGIEDGVQYYYIVNPTTSKNLCYDGTNGVYMETKTTTDDKFKFSIVASGGAFNIIPHRLTSGNRFINKDSNNAADKNINLTGSATAATALWKFVMPSALDKDAPFSVSDGSSTSYYKIENIGNIGNFIVPPTGTATFAEVTASSEASANWYFEVATPADNNDWLTYYYIRNAKTGDYLYFSGTGSNNIYRLEMRHGPETGENAPKYQFTWARTAEISQYYIVPKLWKDKNLKQIASLQKANNATTLSVAQTRTAGLAAWEFDESTYKCATPTITFNGSQYVISKTESDAKIKYSTDNGTTWADYTGPFNTPDSPTTIKAYAYRSGGNESDGTDNSDNAEFPITRVATPTFNQNAGNSVAISCETEGATIHYTLDGTEPTTSSPVYSGPISENISGKTIKAIAVKAGLVNSTIATSNAITLNCATPDITRGNNNTFVLSCSFPTSDVSIYYTVTYGDGTNEPADPADPTTSSTPYTGPVTITNYPAKVKAIAVATNYGNSEISFRTIKKGPQIVDGVYQIQTTDDFKIFAEMVENNEEGEAGAHYKLTGNVNGSNAIAITTPFTGIFEADHDENGNYYKITGLSHALFNTVDGGTVKNVMLDNVNVNVNGNAGAIANEARGAARIYNCGVLATSSTVGKDKDGYDKITSSSSTISGSNYVGSIVGLLDGEARVINCFSFADIIGGSYRGGIVGYNNVEGSNSANLKTMVMNCMYYGNIDGGNKAPIYNGNIISNRSDQSGVSNFNYFWSGASYTNSIDAYNCALTAETRYLQRFEFFRLLMNSNRELAAWWATGSLENKDEMLKWVMEPSQIGTTTPFPILKAPSKYYPSVVNIDAEHAESFTGDAEQQKAQRNQGRKFNTTFTINIQMGTSGDGYHPATGASITTSSVTRNITDKDPKHFNFNYYKVQLPYYNEVGSNNYRKDGSGVSRVVTGWKIVSMSKSAGSFTTGSDATATVDENGDISLTTPYNFADRNCTAKDIYSETNKRVFSQGAYFDVPEGVTSITIEPYWAQCVYVSDAYPDVVYDQGMNNANNVKTVGTVSEQARYTNGQSYSINGDNQVVYTSMGNAAGQMPTSGSVYDNAIVLVGNVHSTDVSNKSSNKAYTIMSIDLDKDNEPDYSYILRYNSRLRVHPVRVDFINIPGLGMAQKSTGGTGTYNFGIMQPLGWFESTNTSLFRFTQFEYDFAGRANSPMILQGGVIEQWVTVGGKEQHLKEAKSVSYYHVGGNVWFKEFHIGVHQDKTQDEFVSPHPPISVTGGDFNELYLTGLYNTPNANYDDNAECYINGGRFGKVSGTGMQGIGAIGGNSKGNIIWQIDNADIDEFYAGGINAAHIAEGNITTVIKNSRVDQFCGGPKFGNMNNDKKVVTNATNCTFRAFFGAGYGGNSYNRRYPDNKNNINGNSGIGWDNWVQGQYTKKYDANYKGVETRIDYQFLPMSNNTQNVARLFVDYVSFSLATTYDVTSKLEGCTITTQPLGRLSISDDFKCLGNFYGGGSLGKVSGDVKSTLTNCTVDGSVFGAGYSATLPKVNVMNNAFQKIPHYDENTGAYTEAILPTTEEYSWEHKEAVNSTGTAIDTGTKKLYTTENLNELGTVTGQVTLNIEGDNTAITGNVYGGGQSSDATSDVEVNVKAGSMVDVYGGGQGETTVVGGTVNVNIGAKANNGDLSGTGSISGSVYGGSALGAVNATSTKNAEGKVTAYTPSSGKTTNVNIYAGAVTGSVFGGGLGQLESGTQGQNGYKPEIAAQNFGNTIVTMEGGTVSTGLYGGANTNGDLKGNSTVTITGGTAGTLAQSGDPNNVVFGGGYGQPTLVEGDVEINLGAANQTTAGATINGSVYGGGALGNVNTSKPESTLVFDATKTTKVNMFKGTVKGNVYGGGLGQKEEGTSGQNGYKAPVESFVGGDVTVELNNGVPDNQKGCIVEGAIFGCNNANGTPKGSVTVHVYKTQNASAGHITNQEGDTDENTKPKKSGRYDLAAVYGGGNQAAYEPTDAENGKTIVIIDGCDRTSIEYVYGGGNAAPVPATDVTANGSFEIDYLFGGGNGYSVTNNHSNPSAPNYNPGADVGLKPLTEGGTPYEKDTSKEAYGTGIATTRLIGGTINHVFGGSNSLGDVRGSTSVSMPSTNDCPLIVKEIYGAGQNAGQSGSVNMLLSNCNGTENYIVYGGAQNDNVGGDVNIVITGGPFKQVFGGNDTSGTIQGSITITIEETGCLPVTIEELYLGGNQAPYSVYGYYDASTTETPNYQPRSSLNDHTDKAIPGPTSQYSDSQWYADPILNVVSCTRIDKIFGGGLGSTATIYGNPKVNVNMAPGKYAEQIDRIEPTGADENENALGTIGDIYGGGSEANVVGNTAVNIGTVPIVTMLTKDGEALPVDKRPEVPVEGAYVTGNIYGGGLSADVEGSTQINIGTVNYTNVNFEGVNITGNVFGGGEGESTKVTGSVAVKIGEKTEETGESGTSVTYSGNATITGDIYGGSALGSVNSSDNSSATSGATTAVTLNTGTITGSVYGGGLGQRNGVNEATSDIISDVYGPVTVTVNNGSVSGAVYGCNNLNGSPKSTVAVEIKGTTTPESPATYTIPTVYGGGNQAPYTGTGGISVSMSDGYVNDVFGGGYGSTAIVTGNTTVAVSGGSARTVYGGGNAANVIGDTEVNITGGSLSGTTFGTVTGAVFGGGFGENTKVSGTVTVNIGATTGGETPTYSGSAAITGDVYGGSAKGLVNTTDGSNRTTDAVTNVNLYGGTINGDLYGGGLGEDNDGTENDHAADVYGPVTVTTQGGKANNVFGCNNLKGEPKNTVAVYIKGTDTPASTGGYAIGRVYGGGNQAAYTYTGSPLNVEISGGTVDYIFGGGLSANVSGSVNVTVKGGTVVDDVYGGGALAHTNIDNWNSASGTTSYYVQVYGLTVGTSSVAGYYTKDEDTYTKTESTDTYDPNITYYEKVDNYTAVIVADGTDVTGYYIKNGNNEYEPATGTADPDVTYYVGGTTYSPVTVSDGNISNYYTKTSGNYSADPIGSGETAAANTKYYEKKEITGSWAEGKNDANTGTTYKTTVNLIGGIVGNVYGGGLGDADHPAYVYGDVTVTMGHATDGSVGATAFTRRTNDAATAATGSPVYKTGHLFGANNINGTPTGDITVNVYKTARTDGGAHQSGKTDSKNFEIQGVYGGGNQADYMPMSGKQTHVNINGCNEVSIEFVYGGGNSASVPGTNVNIQGCYEIGYAFGGGNGNDKILASNNTTWYFHGADVNGDTHIDLHGGTIHWAFGGSNRLGDCTGDIYYRTLADNTDCPLKITTLYGAGQNADLNGSLNLVIKCPSNASDSYIENVYGGSLNARISGSITMTIIGGIYENVYGGNDQSGSIGGPITINIQETDNCQPLIIKNLYGGGDHAPYPQDNGSNGLITINAKSFTRIGSIFGGSHEANVYGNTRVNINTVKGVWATDYNNTDATLPVKKEDYSLTDNQLKAKYTDDIPNIKDVLVVTDQNNNSKKITFKVNDEIGTIGNVFGGGDQGNIIGNAEVNIGTEPTVSINQYSGNNISDTTNPDVLGAHITGDVFGGCNDADVTENTFVNICAIKGAEKKVENEHAGYNYTASNITNYSEGVTIKGTKLKGVFGGGNKGHVNGNSYVCLGAGSVNQSLYGGGCEADVKGNTYVTMLGGYVFEGIAGGGLKGSVGTFEVDKTLTTDTNFDHKTHECMGKPTSCTSGGTCTVVITGGQVGPDEVATQGMKRMTEGKGDPVAEGWVWGGGRGEVEDPAVDHDAHFKTYVNKTDVTIGGTALIMESVIGGGEFGRVLNDTHVTIEGNCQIGVGEGQTDEDGGSKPKRYTDAQWTAAANAVESGNATDINNAAASMPECSHYPYGNSNNEYLPYDPYYDRYPTYVSAHQDFGPASTDNPSDGKTWIGCVFGGGSGYFPYQKKDGAGNVVGYDWCNTAGLVEGNTNVEIKGGHILTNVYGANEYTDVKGKATVTMTGGTIGVPRTLADIAKHPVSCYLFGGGKGDERTHFDQFTNVGSVEVEVSGGIIYGSVFGGAEDGHVLGDAKVTIKPGAKIGTWGTSYVDGNVFGGGRGYSGRNLIAGGVGGNTTIEITGGTMLGSIYGGGRLASVGIDLNEKQESDSYGQLKDETGNQNAPTYGHITIDISGGKIGTTTETGTDHPVGGNVFGGSMGRTTLLDGSTNPLWPKMAVAKLTNVTIRGTAEIMNNVYGGSEYGVVRNRTTVNVSAGTIHGHVFGGGYGSDEQEKTTIKAGGYSSIPTSYYTFTPMTWTGCVSGDTNVNISGGKVKKNVYGGGEFASVGLINFNSNEDGTVYNYITKHDNPDNGFALSWPYKFQYITGAPLDAENAGGKKLGGKATVTITGGRIGTTGGDNYNGYVFGGSKGKVEFDLYKTHTHDANTKMDHPCIIHQQRYVEAFCANVRETEVNIHYTNTPDSDDGSTTECIVGAVYGGGEDGHVEENAKVDITGGLIGFSVYGAGKGISQYNGYLRDLGDDDGETHSWKTQPEKIYSWTAGKVYGNATVTMSGGHVVRNVCGGGYNGSVGKGNYASGTEDYYTHGYGEKINSRLFHSQGGSDGNADFMNSGLSTVTITGGTVGTETGDYDGYPTGQIYGGSRGKAAQDVGKRSPRDEYAPDFFLGYSNESLVTIGDAEHSPTIYGSVYGGGRDGHMRRSAHVIINNGKIGKPYASNAAITTTQWRDRGNVYGSGSGLGNWDATHHGTSSGSVTRNTTVDINGGTIYQNVYGGGANACVGPPRIPVNDVMPDFAGKDVSQCVVNINGGTIGTETGFAADYGGCVYGASRGGDLASDESADSYATTIWTKVNINPHPTDRTKDATIAGDVYGGGQAGRVKKDTEVHLDGGHIYHDAYGGGRGTLVITEANNIATRTGGIAADVGGNTTVELNKYAVQKIQEEESEYVKGCIVDRIFGCNNLNGTPKGEVQVHVYATQTNDNSTNAAINVKKDTKFEIDGVNLEKGDRTDDAYLAYLKETLAGQIIQATNLLDEETVSVYTTIKNKTGVTVEELKSAIIDIRTKMAPVIAADKTRYDVQAVYGGGNLAAYVPNGPGADKNGDDHKHTTEEAKVTIDGCELTSIYQVYGGGNAASTPATKLTINSAYEIYEAFGGGNGNDSYTLNGKTYANPGANVGYEDYTTPTWNETDGQYAAVDNNNATTKDERENNYGYGTGVAKSNVRGGTIHTVFGGSNKKGNIRKTAMSVYEASDDLCPLCVGETYGAGKDAPMDGDIDLTLDCVKDMPIIYGGAKDADVNANITLNITNGTFERVYGGNNHSGNIYGSITVNVEERGCQPIIIDELYGGGYLANYSIYGYINEGTEQNPSWKPRTYAEWNGMTAEQKTAANITKPHADPRINIISATKIGTVYGGGYQALVVGNPHVNVNMTEGKVLATFANNTDGTSKADYTSGEHGSGNNKYVVKTHENNSDAILEIGKIETIFGGGNDANIDGDTYVEIGTGKWVAGWDANGKEIWETEGTENNKKYSYRLNNTNDTWQRLDITENEQGEEQITYTDVTDRPNPFRNEAKITDIVYGGGNNADVTGNTYITMENGSVENRIYGGGKIGNVGTYTVDEDATNDIPDGKPLTCTANTGVSNVTITGGMVGPAGSPKMDPNDETWDKGHVFGAGRGKDPSAEAGLDNLAYVYDTNVTIGGTAFVKGSVYGGSENGHVRHDTHVNIQDDCQIGCGKNTTNRHEEDNPDVWKSTYVPTEDNNLECFSWPYEEPFAPFDPNALTTGKYSNGDESYGMPTGSDGHTFYGGVFGGGSGYYPYKDANGKSQWVTKGGEVEGDTYVAVTGGHILTSLYGGNEMTNVLGNTYVVMTGGTLGVPRTLDQIKNHPVTCYLFGSGKGDQRTFFNTQTNIENAYVYVLNEAKIYGSVFGGGEDGHVHKNAEVNIGKELPTALKNKFSVLKDVDELPGTITKDGIDYPVIGTTGTSYVDGNVFGAGRGFSGDALTAGSVGGNTIVNIDGGTMLGSIYGGGRLASVGIDFTAPNDPTYGQFHEDEKYTQAECDAYNTAHQNDVGFKAKTTDDINPDKTHGHVTVNISGGTIGNDVPNAKYGGNVYGGSMGRLEDLNELPNPLWPQLAQVKTTAVNISGNAHIKHSVYGGGEMGTVRYDAIVNISGKTNTDGTVKMNESPTIEYNVFGGGYGSDINEDTYEATIHTGSGETAKTYTFRPIEFAGCVGGDTHVKISGGLVKRTVYGGGEMATVGLIDLDKTKSQKHDDETSGFALSWPYEYAFIQEKGGTANIEVTGGRIGLSGKDKINSDVEEDNGDIYGGGKGIAGDRYDMSFCGNVRNSVVTIDVPTPTNDQIEIYDRTGSNKWTLRLKELTSDDKIPGIAGSVYGGGEDGHVIENAVIKITNGYIGHSVYGGGKGKGTYKQAITDKDIPCNTAGKVYGNTTIEMTGGWIMRNIYGGGNLGSVGKGNYAGGTDDYYQGGYGERSSGKLWTSDYDPNDTNTSKDDAWHFLNSGKATVNVTGGTVGYMVSESDKAKISVCEKDDLPTGNVFGGCRGQAATEEFLPTYDQNPEFFLGYVNQTEVNIGGTNATKGPIIYGSVYGAGQDGHVRYQTNVTINKGEIGIPYNAAYKAIIGDNLDDLHWLNRGNVYGSGSGIGTYESKNKDVNDNPIKLFSSSSGSTTRNTNVTVNSGITGVPGGVIYRNVYGGGSMASVGPPLINMTEYATKEQSLCTVTIDGAVGTTDETIFVKEYGGEVYGASRGETLDPTLYNNFADFASVIWTKVLVKKNAVIMGNVFGGGDAGVVKKDSEVIVGE